MRGRKRPEFSEETKKKMSEARKGKPSWNRGTSVPGKRFHNTSWDYISGRKEIIVDKDRHMAYNDLPHLLTKYKDRSEACKRGWERSIQEAKNECNKVTR